MLLRCEALQGLLSGDIGASQTFLRYVERYRSREIALAARKRLVAAVTTDAGVKMAGMARDLRRAMEEANGASS